MSKSIPQLYSCEKELNVFSISLSINQFFLFISIIFSNLGESNSVLYLREETFFGAFQFDILIVYFNT